MQSYTEETLFNELMKINLNNFVNDEKLRTIFEDRDTLLNLISSLTGPYSEALYRLIQVYSTVNEKDVEVYSERNLVEIDTSDSEVIELCIRYIIFLGENFI